MVVVVVVGGIGVVEVDVGGIGVVEVVVVIVVVVEVVAAVCYYWVDYLVKGHAAEKQHHVNHFVNHDCPLKAHEEEHGAANIDPIFNNIRETTATRDSICPPPWALFRNKMSAWLVADSLSPSSALLASSVGENSLVILGAAQYNHSLLLVILGATQYNQSSTGSCPVQPQSSTGYTGRCPVQPQPYRCCVC